MEELYRFREFLNENTQFRKIFDGQLDGGDGDGLNDKDKDKLFEMTLKSANNIHQELVKLPMFKNNPKIPNQPSTETYNNMVNSGYFDSFVTNRMEEIDDGEPFEEVFGSAGGDFDDFYISSFLDNFIKDINLMTFLKELDNSKDLDLLHIDIDDNEIMILNKLKRTIGEELGKWFIGQLPPWSHQWMHEDDWKTYEEDWEIEFLEVLRDQHNSI